MWVGERSRGDGDLGYVTFGKAKKKCGGNREGYGGFKDPMIDKKKGNGKKNCYFIRKKREKSRKLSTKQKGFQRGLNVMVWGFSSFASEVRRGGGETKKWPSRK